MVEEDFVKFDTAKLLGKCGYPGIHCALSLINALEKIGQDFSFFKLEAWRENGLPTQSQAMKWLRQRHGIFLEVVLNGMGNYYHLDILEVSTGDALRIEYDMAYNQPEDAYEAGLAIACKYILEGSENHTDSTIKKDKQPCQKFSKMLK